MRGKRFISCLVVFILVAVSASFAQSDDWYYGKKVKDITFVGLDNIQSSDLSGIVAPFTGQEFTDELYSDILNKIYALDYFEDVYPVALPADSQNNTVILQFTVKERPAVAEVIFSGNKQIKSSELREAILEKKGDIYIAGRTLLDERKIRDLYLQKGFTNIKVSSSTVKKDNGVDVTFIINEGKPTVVTSINFQGNDLVASRTLKGELSLKEVSLFNKGAFQESALEADRQAILTYYQNRGYIDATVIDIIKQVTNNEEKNQDELAITFVIREGVQYTYGGLTITGNKIFKEQELLDLIKIKDGAVFNQTRFNAGVTAIMDLYYENGYTSNQFNVDTTKDSERKIISFNLTIVELPRSHIENIVIVGNDKTKDFVILRELPIETGDIFSKAKIESGLRNLYNTQYFSTIVPDFVQGSEDNLVNLVLSVEEGSTTSIEFGVTFSGVTSPKELPMSAFVKWADTNVGGLGKTISTSLTLSNTEQALSLGYSDSWLFGLPISVSASFDFAHTASTTLQQMFLPTGLNTTDYYMDYSKWTIGGSFGLGKRWYPNLGVLTLSGGLSSKFVKNNFDDTLFIPVSTSLNAKYWGVENSLWTSLSLDDRDIYYDPSKGWFASQRVGLSVNFPEFQQNGFSFTNNSNEYFVKADTKAEIYFTLFDKQLTENFNLKFVIMGYSNLSFVQPLTDTLAISNQLYVDGMFIGRGWMNLYSVRGKALWNNTIEFRVPIATGVFGLDFFFDAVALKDDVADLFTNLSLDDFYFSFGPGIRFALPQFPLRLLLSNTFKFDDGKFNWNDKWSFVLSFNISNR